MFVWIGIDVDKYFGACKQRALAVARQMGCEKSCFYALPWHISLKISFEVSIEMLDEVCDAVLDYYKTLHPFALEVQGLENAKSIVWVRYRHSEYLAQVKDGVNAMLLRKFGIALHEYDSDFIFHTTLFMDGDEAANAEFFCRMQGVELPQSVDACKFLVGVSRSLLPDDYTIYRKVELA